MTGSLLVLCVSITYNLFIYSPQPLKWCTNPAKFNMLDTPFMFFDVNTISRKDKKYICLLYKSSNGDFIFCKLFSVTWV